MPPDPLASGRSSRSDAVPSARPRVAVLYEPGRRGSAALRAAGRLVAGGGSTLTVVSLAPQDTRICCGAGSATDYNRAVCEAAAGDLQKARSLLGPVCDRASFRLLVERRDPPLATWVAAGDFDVVLLPARRRPLRRSKHPVADELRRATRASVRVVGPGSSPGELGPPGNSRSG